MWYKKFNERLSSGDELTEEEERSLDDCRQHDAIITPVLQPKGLLDWEVSGTKILVNPKNGTRAKMEKQQAAIRKAEHQILKDGFMKHIVEGQPIEEEDENICDTE